MSLPTPPRTWAIYDAAGDFRAVIVGDEETRNRNLPQGASAWPDVMNPSAWRVVAGELVPVNS
jgi:hypothetical protein